MSRVTQRDLDVLSRFTPEVYAIDLGETGRRLEKKGLVRWVPRVWGHGVDYQITDAGRAALTSAHKGGE